MARLPLVALSLLLPSLALVRAAPAQQPIAVDDRLELFVDHHLIESLDGVHLRLCAPRPAGVALRLDRPWEGIVSGYFTVLRIDDGYRMYYRGRPGTSRADGKGETREVTCVAFSRDGVAWTRPSLGLVEIGGTVDNNVILANAGTVTHNFCPFVDERPGVGAGERFKALGGLQSSGLFAYVSGDGLRWRRLGDGPVLRKGAFDSQNVAFWSTVEERYVCYFRTWEGGVRWISRATSDDFEGWSEPVPIDTGAAPREHLYTNQTQPYSRAPHIYVATPARFWPGRRALTDDQIGAIGLRDPRNYAGLEKGASDAVFMTSRDGVRFARTFLESWVRPGPDPRNWVARANYPALGIVPTGPGELSIYVQRHYGQPSAHVERLTLRTDGFAAVSAPYAGGELRTRLLTFAPRSDPVAPRQLVLNFSTSAAGGVRVEIQDGAGEPLPGRSLADADELIGDSIERAVTWNGGRADISDLAGRPVRLCFSLRDADLFSLRFR